MKTGTITTELARYPLEKVLWLANHASNPHWKALATAHLRSHTHEAKYCRICALWLPIEYFDDNGRGNPKRYCRICNPLRRRPRPVNGTLQDSFSPV